MDAAKNGSFVFLDLDLNIRHFWARNVIGTFEKRAPDNSREISFA